MLALVCAVIFFGAEESAVNNKIKDNKPPKKQTQQTQVSKNTTIKKTSKSTSKVSIKERKKAFENFYKKSLVTKDSSQRLVIIEQALKLAQDQRVGNKKQRVKLHTMAANIHYERWHVYLAIQSYQAAQNIQFNTKTDVRLKKLKKHLAKIESERKSNQDYIATRNSGPAKILKGKVFVAYVFVDDGIKTRWSEKNIQKTKTVLNYVQTWQKQEAERYQINNLEFINKAFMIQRNPNLKALATISYKSNRQQIEGLVDVMIKHLGAKDVKSFLNKEMQKVGANQGVIFFHSNFERRSFARRCGYTHMRVSYINGVKKTEYQSRCHDEYVMLMEKIKRNRWDKLHYVQAHESLHLFGADDLYNIESASSFATTDIMNFQSRYLKDSEISPVTAFAIGWRNGKPKTPFKILEK